MVLLVSSMTTLTWLTSRIVQRMIVVRTCRVRIGGADIEFKVRSRRRWQDLFRLMSVHWRTRQVTRSGVRVLSLQNGESSHLRSMIKKEESAVAPTEVEARDGVGSTSTSTSNGDASHPLGLRQSEARRAAVDYTKLNEEMENERKKAKSDE